MDFRGEWKPLKKLPKRAASLFVDLHAASSAVSKKSSLMATPDEDAGGFYEILYFDSNVVFAIVAIESETSEIVVAAPLPPGSQTHVLGSTPFDGVSRLECWEQFDALTAGPNSLTHVWQSSTVRTRAELVRVLNIARHWRKSLNCIRCGEPISLEEIEEAGVDEYHLHGAGIRVREDGSAVARSSEFRCGYCVSQAWTGLDVYKSLEIWGLSPDDAETFRCEGVPVSYLRDIAVEGSESFRFGMFDSREISTLFRLGVAPGLVIDWLNTSHPFKLIEVFLAARPNLLPLVDEEDEWLLPSERDEKRMLLESGLERAHGYLDWPEVAREFVARGVPIASVPGWLLTGLDVRAVTRFVSLGISSDDFDGIYSEWSDWGLDVDDYITWVRKIQAASKRLPAAAKELVDSLPVDFGTWAEVGITDANEALMWFEAGFSPMLLTHDGVDPYTRHTNMFSVEDAGVIRNAWRARRPRDWDALVLRFPDYLDAIVESIPLVEMKNFGDWFALPPGLIEPVCSADVSPHRVFQALDMCAKDEVGLGDDVEPNWAIIEDTIKAIIEVGLPVTFDNVAAWYGCESDEILAAIDNGLTASSMQLAKQGLTQSQIDSYVRLVDGGLDADRAMDAIRDGFDLRLVEMWEGEGVAGAVRYFRNSLLGLGAHLSIGEVHAWWKAGFTVASFVPKRPVGSHTDWRICGFVPTDARKWALAGFDPVDAQTLGRGGLTPATARPWIDAGFDARRAAAWSRQGISPEVARRREQAGLSP
jgi:hypothetical protein